MKASDTLGELAPALVAVQAEVRNAAKSAEGYGYNYAPLDAIVEEVRPILAKHGLAVVQLPTLVENGEVGLTTRIIHESGEWIEELASIPAPSVGRANQAQMAGAALTYLRRYMLTAALNIAAEEDTDVSTHEQRTGNGQRNTQGQPQVADPKVNHEQVAYFNGRCQQKYGDEWESRRNEIVSAMLRRRGVNGADPADLLVSEIRELNQGLQSTS